MKKHRSRWVDSRVPFALGSVHPTCSVEHKACNKKGPHKAALEGEKQTRSVGFLLALALAGLGVLLGEQALVAEEFFPPLVQQGVGVVLRRVEIALEEV